MENKYCAEFSYSRKFWTPEEQEIIKKERLKELAAAVIPLLDKGEFHAIAVDYSEKPVRRDEPDLDAGMTHIIRAKWTITVEPVKTVIVEVPKIESPHYKLPVTDSLKERAAAAWNYFRGKGEIS